ncbi:hypothetical protein EVAR_96711_1 [Eumeta japonica]|uniref:Uncharacterized protein n=1 Tax=Eumeta variegata TaxID=151549 RepID=A0A4C1WK21_EUMVA|nr:hypothetical protein EVAR_96711_1 [Eumeta japonica]
MPEWKGRVPLTRSHCERITVGVLFALGRCFCSLSVYPFTGEEYGCTREDGSDMRALMRARAVRRVAPQEKILQGNRRLKGFVCEPFTLAQCGSRVANYHRRPCDYKFRDQGLNVFFEARNYWKQVSYRTLHFRSLENDRPKKLSEKSQKLFYGFSSHYFQMSVKLFRFAYNIQRNEFILNTCPTTLFFFFLIHCNGLRQSDIDGSAAIPGDDGMLRGSPVGDSAFTLLLLRP